MDLASRLDAALYVIHAVNLEDYPIDMDAADWEQQAEAALAEQREAVRSVLAGHRGPWRYEAWSGEPGPVLVEAADDHDASMIVVGRRRHGRLHLLTSAALPYLAGHTSRPILLVSSPFRGADQPE